MQVAKPKKGYKLVKTSFGKYEIPEEWEYNELSKVCKIAAGDPAPQENEKFSNEGIPFVRVFDLSKNNGKKFLSETRDKISLDIGKKIRLRLFPKDSIILPKSGVSTLLNYRAILSQDSFVVSHNAIIIPKKTSRDFLFYQLSNLDLGKFTDRTSLPSLKLSELQKIKIPLPPLPEQKQIASILSNVDDTLQKTNQIIEQTQRLKNGMMQKLLTRGIGHTKFKKTKIGEIPEEWEAKKLGEVSEITRGKFGHRPRNDPDYYGGKHPFIQTGDVENAEGFITDYSQTLNDKGLSVSKYFPSNTIVITIAANIGGTAITTFPVCFPDSLIGITSKIMDIRFLEYYLRTQKKYLESVAHTSAQKNINYQNLKPLLVAVPPLPEQKQIVSILSNVDTQIQKEKLHKSNLERLKKGLMQKLLTGQIRVKVR